jgi:hypothetical protein
MSQLACLQLASDIGRDMELDVFEPLDRWGKAYESMVVSEPVRTEHTCPIVGHPLDLHTLLLVTLCTFVLRKSRAYAGLRPT